MRARLFIAAGYSVHPFDTLFHAAHHAISRQDDEAAEEVEIAPDAPAIAVQGAEGLTTSMRVAWGTICILKVKKIILTYFKCI